MSFITGSDETARMDFTLFPKIYKLYFAIERGDLLKIRGKVEKRLNKYQIVVEKIKYLKEKSKKDEK